ncbi:cse1l [Symbiodinium natans]|uniref:Cse1l protein n=1 Tax=Symbiodinium natans TaxID=878477 RepID=A0A812SAY8_9DINO|nr:cse1l [Symbiodinium natans]
MAASPEQMAQLAQLLTQTVAGNMEAMKVAEQQLRTAEVQPGFGLVLLELLRSGSVEVAARQAGAIYFKNYIRRQWCVEGAGGISTSDRQAIKQHILSLMLQAPKQVQVQLSAGLEEISITDYPSEWQSLLPEIVQHLKTSQDMSVLKGTMQTAHTVFLKFRAQARSEDLLREVKYTVEGFQETHLAVFTATCRQVLGGASMPADQLVSHFELLLATIGAFFSMNVIDLPEFFEDHREEYFRGFLELLKFQHEAVAGKDQQGLLEQVKGAICECLVLYADKYQEEFMPFLLPCVKEVWSLLVGLDQQEKNDQLVAKGIQFLSSTAATQWPQSPFEDPNVLSGICEKVVFPNVLLRDSDVELFEDNPLEYVRRDMEAADQETRRRSSMDLVKAMGRLNEAKVTEILIGYVKALMDKAASAGGGQAERFKDACIFLCIAMAVREQTQREGVTVTNQNVNVLHFFTSLVAPELTAEPLSQRSVLRASCLKFVTVFRNQLPREQVGQVLPAICSHIASESPVVHTYAAICIEKLLRVRDATPQAPVERQSESTGGDTAAPVTAFDPTLKPPDLAKNPLKVVVLMRHGDRTPVCDRIGQLDMADLNPKWTSLLPTAQELSAVSGVRVERDSEGGHHAYARFVGQGSLGQLTGLGFQQCRKAGAELRRRYGDSEIRAFSTDFPRTIQSAACVLLGFGCTVSTTGSTETSSLATVRVRGPKDQTLLPNYDGRCSRFAQGREAARSKAKATHLKEMRHRLETLLLPVIGEDPLNAVLDFKPHCVHQDVVGKIQGVDWDLAHLVESYQASLEAAVYSDFELLRLGSGRLVQEVIDVLASPGHGITLLLAHDNMLTAFLIALGIYKQQWPLYASQVVLETAQCDGAVSVRVLMNDEVCLDWQPWDDLHGKLRPVAMSQEEYAKSLTQEGQLAPRYDPASMKGQLLQMVQPILQIIASSKGIPMNEYLMRTVARIFSFLKQQGAETGLATLSPLSAILLAMSANPSNPVFNHYLFEAVASIVKVCVPAQPDAVESALLPTFGQILERNVVDFLPYTFQIMGLLLDASPSIKPLYTQLFARLLTPELWRAQANVPGLIRLLRAYFAKHAGFAELLRTHMQAILERFQFVLMNRKTEVAALDLLNAMYQYLPIEFYQPFLKTLLTVVLTRLQSSKSPKFKRDFVVSCSLCIHKNQAVIPLFNEIQAGLLSNLVLNVWPPVLKMPLRTDERKVCVMAVAKLLSLDEMRQNTQLVGACAVGLVHLLGLSSTNKSKLNGDEGSDDEPLEDGGAGQEYEVAFNKLQNTDLPGAAAGLAPDVPELQSAAKAALKPVLGGVHA